MRWGRRGRTNPWLPAAHAVLHQCHAGICVGDPVAATHWRQGQVGRKIALAVAGDTDERRQLAALGLEARERAVALRQRRLVGWRSRRARGGWSRWIVRCFNQSAQHRQRERADVILREGLQRQGQGEEPTERNLVLWLLDGEQLAEGNLVGPYPDFKNTEPMN